MASSLVLFFVGSVLMLNGLSLLGFVNSKATYPINLFVGGALAILALGLIVRSKPDSAALTSDILHAGGFLLFAFTYLYVFVSAAFGLDSTGTGWYCGWAALVSGALSIVNFTILGDHAFGWIWLAWVFLFIGFWLVLGLGKATLGRAVGVLTVLQAFSTAALPGFLDVVDLWSSIPVGMVAVVQIVIVLVSAMIAWRDLRAESTVDGADVPRSVVVRD